MRTWLIGLACGVALCAILGARGGQGVAARWEYARLVIKTCRDANTGMITFSSRDKGELLTGKASWTKDGAGLVQFGEKFSGEKYPRAPQSTQIWVLNLIGAEGWELISQRSEDLGYLDAVEQVYLFKRPR